MGKQISNMTVIGVHLTMHLMYPKLGHATVMCACVGCVSMCLYECMFCSMVCKYIHTPYMHDTCQSTLVSPIDLLIRHHLWTVAAQVIKLCPLEDIRNKSQVSVVWCGFYL